MPVSNGASPIKPGKVFAWAGRTAPPGYAMCYGQALSRATYAALYNELCPVLGAVTVTIASPGVFTLNGHGLNVGDRVRLTTTGALPTGLTANTDYYVTATSLAANTFTLSATLGGAAINTSGTQSGTHTAQFFGWGAGDGSTTFNVPDLRGRTVAGADAMGGVAANRLTSGGAGIYAGALGAAGGSETHTLTTAQLASHGHSYNDGKSGGEGWVNNNAGSIGLTGGTTGAAGSGNAHNNTQPTAVANYIIKV